MELYPADPSSKVPHFHGFCAVNDNHGFGKPQFVSHRYTLPMVGLDRTVLNKQALKARGSTSRSGPAVPQARAGSECLRVLGVQALASPQSGRFADVSPDTTRSQRASFRFLAHAGPFGVWQLRCDASEA